MHVLRDDSSRGSGFAVAVVARGFVACWCIRMTYQAMRDSLVRARGHAGVGRHSTAATTDLTRCGSGSLCSSCSATPMCWGMTRDGGRRLVVPWSVPAELKSRRCC